MFKKKIDQQFMAILFILPVCMTLFLMGMEKQHKKIVATGSFSSGHTTIIGSALVVTDYKACGKLCKGDILVTYATDGLCEEKLQLSAGIITEKAGKNSHAALLGKKLGIPVMVGVKDATKKINDGSLILLDCNNKTVYEVDTDAGCNESNLHFISNNHYRTHELNNVTFDYSFTPSDYRVSSFNALERGSTICSAVPKIPISNNYLLIMETYVEDVHKNIKQAEKWGKKAAYWFAGISNYAFESIPFEFFTDEIALHQTFGRFEKNFDQAINKMKELKEICQKELSITTKIDESKLAEFLHRQVVAKIDVSDENRDILMREPSQMNKLIRENIVNKDQYMDLVFLNFVVRRELEEDLKAAQKK